MGISEDEFETATCRGEVTKLSCPSVVAVRFDAALGRIVISLSSGVELSFAPRDAQGLENAGADDLEAAEISPSGLGVHFPRIDADIYIPELLRGRMGTERWMAARRAGGETPV